MARTALLDQLEASSRTPVAAVIAPPGYGKTTLLAQWADRDPRSFGWLTVDGRDNDPSVLLRNLAAAFDRIEPVDRELLVGRDGPEALVDVALPLLGRRGPRPPCRQWSCSTTSTCCATGPAWTP